MTTRLSSVIAIAAFVLVCIPLAPAAAPDSSCSLNVKEGTYQVARAVLLISPLADSPSEVYVVFSDATDSTKADGAGNFLADLFVVTLLGNGTSKNVLVTRATRAVATPRVVHVVLNLQGITVGDYQNFQLEVKPDIFPTPGAGKSLPASVSYRGKIQSSPDDVAKCIPHPGNTDSEKDIFAGFNAAKGSGQATQGNADISLNPTLPFGIGPFFDQGSFVVTIKKSSAGNADLKQFDLGLHFRKFFGLASAEDRKTIGHAFMSSRPTPDELKSASEALARISSFIPKPLVDETLQMEAEAFNFNVTNFVSDSRFQLAFPILGKFGVGHAKFRMMPVGFELGRNMHSVSSMVSQEPIARVKFGATFNASYQPKDQSKTPIKSVEFEAQALGRYLFERETLFDQNMKEMNIGKGPRRYYNVHLKTFFAESDKLKYGFQLSLTRGSLPPAFAFTNSFEYGFIMESKDDTTSSKGTATKSQ